MEHEKQIDEAWKDSVTNDKDLPEGPGREGGAGDFLEVNFVNYITSLAFQAMIFLGEVPNPLAENKVEKHPQQAKFLIDTLILLRDKTKGNLTKEEEGLLEGTIYELQMKYIELSGKKETTP